MSSRSLVKSNRGRHSKPRQTHGSGKSSGIQISLINRLEDHATKDQQQKVQLALRDDSVSAGVDDDVEGHLELINSGLAARSPKQTVLSCAIKARIKFGF